VMFSQLINNGVIFKKSQKSGEYMNATFSDRCDIKKLEIGSEYHRTKMVSMF
jgi:hypothetical protein